MLRPTTKPSPAAPIDTSSFNPAKDSYFNLRKDTARFDSINNVSIESLASSAHSVATSGQQSAAGENAPELPLAEITVSPAPEDRMRHALSDSDIRPIATYSESASLSTGNLHKLLHNKLLAAAEGISPSGSVSSAMSSNNGSTGSLVMRPGPRIRSASNAAGTYPGGASPVGVFPSRAHGGSSDSVDKKIESGKTSHKGSSLGIEIPKSHPSVAENSRESKSSTTSKKVKYN
jgi:hypothetical protein